MLITAVFSVVFVGCAGGHIVQGLTEKLFISFCANEKSFYLRQSHIIMQMED